MTDWAQEVSDEVAEAGYIAVAPDLLSGMAPGGGRTSDFAEGKATEAVSHLDPDQVTADLNAVADYALKASRVERQTFRRRFLLGRRPELPLRDEPSRSLRGVRLLRSAAGERRDGPHQGAGVRILCRQRRADWRHDSRRNRANEGRRESRSSRSPTTAPATDSCAPEKRPTRATQTRKLATKPGCGGRLCWRRTNNALFAASGISRAWPSTLILPFDHVAGTRDSSRAPTSVSRA